ncbi:hypothetical protein [Nocardioides gilvus]|uniref:hypothetical protein n=1 Tax=Nocardioides gilvus TaxID=1735589 RepID=UPI0013A54DC4|nr:hypothetical protein [Nocardioides gilvus]
MTTSARRTFPFPATAALLLTSALLLTGCGAEEPVPKFAPAPTVAPSAGTPTPVDEKSAEEFIRRWNDEQRDMQKGDTSKYRQIAGDCETCMKAADRIDEIYASGGFVKTDGRKVRSIKPSGPSENAENTYVVEVYSSPTSYRESSQAPEESLNGGVATYRLQLSRSAGKWAVQDIWTVPRDSKIR